MNNEKEPELYTFKNPIAVICYALAGFFFMFAFIWMNQFMSGKHDTAFRLKVAGELLSGVLWSSILGTIFFIIGAGSHIKHAPPQDRVWFSRSMLFGTLFGVIVYGFIVWYSGVIPEFFMYPPLLAVFWLIWKAKSVEWQAKKNRDPLGIRKQEDK